MPEHIDSLPAMRLFKGHTMHKRFAPVEHQFRYRLFLLDLDIDRLEDAHRQSRLFSIDRPNLFSFKPTEHGNRRDADLRPWAEQRFQEAGIELEGGKIRLVTLARHLFYKFAPISLWFGYDRAGKLRGIIYEVNNTFGQTHSYVAPITEARSQHEADKALYVSPFFDVSGKYRFTLRPPTDKLSLVVENLQGDECQHMATIKGSAHAATSFAFLTAAAVRPLSSVGVSLAIHFEALRLWIKGAGYRSSPGPPATAASSAIPITPHQSDIYREDETIPHS